jgi:hypothetical protein
MGQSCFAFSYFVIKINNLKEIYYSILLFLLSSPNKKIILNQHLQLRIFFNFVIKIINLTKYASSFITYIYKLYYFIYFYSFKYLYLNKKKKSF